MFEGWKMAELVLRETVTADNYSPIVGIITWILLGTMVLGICLRVTLNAFIAQTFKGDDHMLIVALVSQLKRTSLVQAKRSSLSFWVLDNRSLSQFKQKMESAGIVDLWVPLRSMYIKRLFKHEAESLE